MHLNLSDLELDEPDMEPISIDAAGNLLPDKHDKTIIIDADTLVFAACSVCQQDLGDEVYTINMDEAYNHAMEKLTLILDRIGGKEENVELYFTGGKDNFRYDLLEEAFPDDIEMWYKAKRKKKTAPVGLYELKKMFISKKGGIISYDYEADDAVVFRKKQLGEDAILVAVDKDVIENTVGRHWNYYDNKKYGREMKWVEIDEEYANYHQYLQVITGDKSDNVPGLPGIGPKKAEKFIDLGMTCSELWDGVVRAYHKHCKYGDPVEMAVLNMRLVNMHQLTDEGIVLWDPKNI